MHLKKYLFIMALMQGTLMAMGTPPKDQEKSFSLDELRAMLTKVQELRLLNEERNLPAISCTIKLLDTHNLLEIINKHPSSEREYIAEADKEGNYVLESSSSSTRGLKYHPVITRLCIDPENRHAPLITYRITNIEATRRDHLIPEESDITLSIPYATPRIFDLKICHNDQPAAQTLHLGLLIEKTTSPNLPEEIAIADAILKQESA